MLHFLVNQLQTTCYAIRFSWFIESDRNSFFSPGMQGEEAFEYLEEMHVSVGINNKQVFDALLNQRDSLMNAINELLTSADSFKGISLSVDPEEPYRVQVNGLKPGVFSVEHEGFYTPLEAHSIAQHDTSLYLLSPQNDNGELGVLPGEDKRCELLRVSGDQDVGRVLWPLVLDYDATVFSYYFDRNIHYLELSEK